MGEVLQLGIVASGPPIPPVLEETTFVEAGEVSFGVEYRVLTDEVIESSTVELDPDRPTGFDSRGFTIHVYETRGHREYLRFDCFDNDPHYHYITPGEVNRVIAYDVAGNGDMWAWTLECLRSRLPAMLEKAGAAGLAKKVDAERVLGVIPRVIELAHRGAEIGAGAPR